MKRKTEARQYAEMIHEEASKRWGSGWHLLSDRQQHCETSIILMSRVLAQVDESSPIGFFKNVVRELLDILYPEARS